MKYLLILGFLIFALTTPAQNFAHVVIVVGENTNYTDALAQAPYITSLGATYSAATQYYASTHPSIGNYEAMVAGTIDTNDDSQCPNTFIISHDNIVKQIIASGKQWRQYAESIPNAGYIGCDATGPDGGAFYTRHAPLPYYSDAQAGAQPNNIVPFSQFTTDMNNLALPDYSFVTPNGCDDAHDCSIVTFDNWVKNNIGAILTNSQFIAQNGVLIIVWDESGSDNTNGGGRVQFVVAGPKIKKAYSSSTLYQHPSLCRWSAELIGVAVPSACASAPTMSEFVKAPTGPLTISGQSGTVIVGQHIANASGTCLTITNSTNITIKSSEIGPCSGNAIVVSGTSNNVTIKDNYIHPDATPHASCCDTHDSIWVNPSSPMSITISGNVIAHGEANMEVTNVSTNNVIGNFLLNPVDSDPSVGASSQSRGQNYQCWMNCSGVAVQNNYALSSTNTGVYGLAENQEDSINFGPGTAPTVTGNYVQGGHSDSGCGIIADESVNSVQFNTNTLVDNGQCGIGIADGTNQTVNANKIWERNPIMGGGNTAIYVSKFGTGPCGPVTVTNNVASAKTTGGVFNSFFNNGDCGTVTLTGNTFDAAAASQPIPNPPSIPPGPISCVAPSPWTTNVSLVSCAVNADPPPPPPPGSLWSTLLNPTSGTGACSPAIVNSGPQRCAIDWSTAGVVGGIPSGSWTQSGSTITATSGDRTAAIQAALNACGTNHYVLEGPGTFNITHLTIPSNCVLRGSGTLTSTGTINNTTGTGGSPVYALGNGGPAFTPTSTNITSGATAGSTSIVVASASGISVGTLLGITELNDSVYVTQTLIQGSCTWCDGTGDGGVRTRGQTVQVTNVSGTTLTIAPALYTNYGTATGTSPAQAWPFAVGGQNEGVELLQTYANGTMSSPSAVFAMNACVNCWVKEVFNNYADADHVDVINGLHDEIRDSYFSNDYVHSPGSTDSEIDLQLRTSATLVENNILERLHVGAMAEWGAAGNVIAYNYDIGNFDSSCGCNVIMEFGDDHGAHPQFNLWEGNIGSVVQLDSFWGTGGNLTFYRNLFRSVDTIASPASSGRNNVNWSSTVFANQQMWGIQISFGHTNINAIGNVFGSADAKSVATTLYNSGASPFTDTIVPSATRNYTQFFAGISVGYDTGGDSNGSGVASFAGGYWVGKASGSLFQHGNFDIASNSVKWNGSITQTLPASFYKSSKPSWWGSVPWPAIGPDVTGGTLDNSTLGGHANAIPAEVCYNSESRDATGIKLFDPTVCYAAGPPPPPPNPPSVLSIIVVN